MLIIGRLPALDGQALKGQHRVTINIARHIPVPSEVLTILKRGGLLRRAFQWHTLAKTTQGITFEEVSVTRMLWKLTLARRVLVTAGYYYGLLACVAKVLSFGKLKLIHRTGGFVREERRIARELHEEDGNSLLNVVMEYLVLRFADKVAVNSEFYRSKLHEVYPFTRHKTILLPNGIDDSLIPSLEQSPATDSDRVRLLSVCNLFGKKGIDVLVETFIRVRPVRPMTLTIVGDGLRSMRDFIERKSRELAAAGDGKVLELRSHLDNSAMRELYEQADIYVQLSRLDEGPSAVLEAYAYGLPLLLSDQVGVHPGIQASPLCHFCRLDSEIAAAELESLVLANNRAERACPARGFLKWERILSEAEAVLLGKSPRQT